MSKDPKSTYYDAGGIETIDIIKAKLTPGQYKGYLLGNALKYSCRMMHKHVDNKQRKRDAEKAANYSRWLLESFDETPKPQSIVIDRLDVCGHIYYNLKVEVNAQGKFDSGYIPGVGEIGSDSVVTQAINGYLHKQQK